MKCSHSPVRAMVSGKTGRPVTVIFFTHYSTVVLGQIWNGRVQNVSYNHECIVFNYYALTSIKIFH